MDEFADIVAVMDKAACVLAAKGADLLANRLQAAATMLSTRAADVGVVDDDLRQRCADILTWRKTGSLPFGTALRRFADDRRFDRHETDRLRAAEDATLHEAATALAAVLGKSNG